MMILERECDRERPKDKEMWRERERRERGEKQRKERQMRER